MHPRVLQFTSLLTLSLFAGCALGPNYRRPAVEAPAKFRGQGGPTNESLACLPWWKVFKDPVLQELIGEALKNNYDLKIAISRIEQSRARKVQARAAFFPQLGYSGGAERARTRGTTIPASSTPATTLDIGGTAVTIPGSSTPEMDVAGPTINTFTIQGAASWEIDLWGRIRRSNEVALANLLATEEARSGVVQTLVSEVARAYFELRALDEELEISRQAVASFSQTLELFTKQQAGGVASDLEVSRGTASLAAAASAIPKIEQRIVVAENRLSILLGRNPGPIKRGNSLLGQRTPPSVPAGIPCDLLERRPDLRQAEQRVVAANAEVGIAITNFLPAVDLTAGAGVISPALSKLTKGTWSVWNVGGGINGPIFQGGRLVGIYKETKARWQETVFDYERIALIAFSEVADALSSRQKFAQARVQQETQVDALKQSVKLATDRYTIGISTYYEVLEAQQQLFPAEVSLAQTRLNQLLAVVDLYKALGGGWMEECGPKPKARRAAR